MSDPNGSLDFNDPLPPEVAQRRQWGSWILFAAIAVVIFLVGVTLGAVAHRTAATVRVTATVTAVVTANANGGAVVGGATTGQFGDGLYQVGVDIAAGNYQTNGGQNCYWERLRDLSGGFSGIIANGEPTEPTTVRVLASDKGFGVHGGCLWAKVN